MKANVIGAGASIEIAIQAGVSKKHYPPTISNFAEKLWGDSEAIGFQNYWVGDYLKSLGLPVGSDPTRDFIKYERSHDAVNIEKLFEYCWLHRGEKFEEDYQNLIYHGITNALNDLLIRGFCINGNKLENLVAGQNFSRKLNDGDLVVDLNYDTLFEISAEQAGVNITYIPNKFDGKGLAISKPHGSLNLLADDKRFIFCQSNCLGALPSSSDNLRNYNAIVPPRFNKNYQQHPIAKYIIDHTLPFEPDTILFWGVGLTESDCDLLDLYKHWSRSASSAEVINPNESVADKVSKTLNLPVSYYSTLYEWLNE